MALKTKSSSAEERYTHLSETHLLSLLASLKDVGSCEDEEANKAAYGERSG